MGHVRNTEHPDHVADRLLAEGPELAIRVARRLGVKVAEFTILRWIVHGVEGVRLEGVRVGRQWHTTEAAMRRFLRARTDASVASDGPTASPAARSEAAKARLRSRGMRA